MTSLWVSQHTTDRFLKNNSTFTVLLTLVEFQLLKLVNHSWPSSLVGKTSQTIVVFKECELLIECLDSGQNSLSHTFINEPTKKHHWSLFTKNSKSGDRHWIGVLALILLHLIESRAFRSRIQILLNSKMKSIAELWNCIRYWQDR